ncbi:MAG: hypothetical protein K8L91_17265 [Anaerolineae bacterium]|nr:hypothetical protein [Anaerolineae bacterium]
MVKIIQWALGLMAICLVLLTGFMALSRENEPFPSLILRQGDLTFGESQHLALLLPGMATPRPLTPEFAAVQYLGLSPDGKWLRYIGQSDTYYMGAYITGGYYQIETNLHSTRQLADDAYAGMWTPDAEWLIYESDTGLWRVRRDGAERLDIGTLLPAGYRDTLEDGAYFSRDSQSLVFVANNFMPGSGNSIVFKFDIPAGTITAITEPFGASISLIDWFLDEDWLLVRIHNTFYWLRPDGSALVPLLDDPDNFLGYVRCFTQECLLIEYNRQPPTYDAFYPGHTQPHLAVEGNRSFLAHTDEWLIFQRQGESARLERMARDGDSSELTVYGDELTGLYTFWQWVSPDGAWAIMQETRPEKDPRYYSVNLLTGDQTFRAELPYEFEFVTWSPDSQWMLWTEPTQVGLRNRLYLMGREDAELERIADDRVTREFVGWGPIFDKTWSAGLLGMIGVGLVGMPLLIEVSRRRPVLIARTLTL